MSNAHESRTADGRFVKGHPGGPGRPRKAVKAASDALDQRAAAAASELFEMAYKQADEGNTPALKMLLDRVWPVGGSRPMEFVVPQINNVHDLLPAMAGVTNAITTGDATAVEVAAAARVLKAYMDAIQILDHEGRLTEWERSVGKK